MSGVVEMDYYSDRQFEEMINKVFSIFHLDRIISPVQIKIIIYLIRESHKQRKYMPDRKELHEQLGIPRTTIHNNIVFINRYFNAIYQSRIRIESRGRPVETYNLTDEFWERIHHV